MTATSFTQFPGSAAGRSALAARSGSIARSASSLSAVLRDSLAAGRASSTAGPRAQVAIAADFAARVRS